MAKDATNPGSRTGRGTKAIARRLLIAVAYVLVDIAIAAAGLPLGLHAVVSLAVHAVGELLR